jgi:hypothetical protein
MSYFSTLGYTPNPLIEKYQDAFLSKIQKLWITQIGGDMPDRNFLLYPDVHGLLLASTRPYEEQKKDEYLELLRRKYRDDPALISSSSEEQIEGTHILLTMDFENPDVMKHAHPDHKKNGVSVGYGTLSPKIWRDLFRESFRIVREVSPGFMSEINLMIHKIIPFDVSR